MSAESARQVAHFVLGHLRSQHGRKWLGARQPGHSRPSPDEKERLINSPEQLLSIYQLKGVGRDAHAGLLGWLQNRYPLYLRSDIPSPRQMLDEQCEGRRPVSLVPAPIAGSPHPFGRHKNNLEFLLHDLEHGYKFFGQRALCQGQIEFFRSLRAALPHLERFSADSLFERELEYLMGDMNSHPLHMTKYLLAITLNALVRANQRNLFEMWIEDLAQCWQVKPEVCQSLLRINNPGLETESDRIAVSTIFLKDHL